MSEQTTQQMPSAPRTTSIARGPFVAYLAIWAAFSVYTVWSLSRVPTQQPVVTARPYAVAVAGGVLLTLAGPLLAIAALWTVDAVDRGRLFASALLKGSLATLVGVLLWWCALIAVDQMRFGRIL